jgi:1-acyl-sn-glycerol-3-phosphate acyltransferase
MGILYAVLGVAGTLLTLVFAFVLVVLFSFIFVNPNKEYEKKSPYHEKLTNVIAWCVLKVCNIKVETTGLEKIPQNERFFLVCNHRSFYEIVALRVVLKKYGFVFISKPENFDIPFVSKIAKRLRFMPIDRENPRNAMKTLLKAIDFIKKDEGSVAVFPEGTRSRDGKLGEFHDGVFKIAIKSGAPVLVTSVVGSEKVKGNMPFKKTEVYLDFLDCFHAQAGENSHDLAEKSRALIENKIFEREGKKEETVEVENPQSVE